MGRMKGPALVRGAGDVATAVAIRLLGEGFAVVCTELPRPLAIRRTVAFAEAVYEGRWTVAGVEARRARTADEALRVAEEGAVPVLAPEGEALRALSPRVLVDARMAKRNLGTGIGEAEFVIGLGPGFTAGTDCHAAVETLNGPDLGRVYLRGSPLPPTHEPCRIGGLSSGRVLRAPAEGPFIGFKRIGDRVEKGELVGICAGVRLHAPCPGVIRGILRSGVRVPPGTKVLEIDPRGDPAVCFAIADRSLRIAGGVVSALAFLGALD